MEEDKRENSKQETVNSEEQTAESPTEDLSIPPHPHPDEVHQPPDSPTAKKSKKLLLVGIAVILLVVAGGIAAFFYFQNQKADDKLADSQSVPTQQESPPTPTGSPDPTADWKTHTNEIVNYSFKYKLPAEDDTYNNVDLTDKVQTISGAGHLFFRVEVLDSTLTDPVVYWEEQAFEGYTKHPRENFNSKVQNGIDFVYLKDKGSVLPNTKVLKLESKSEKQEPFAIFRTYIFFQNNNLIKLTLGYGDYSDQILSTFEFIETKTTNSETLILAENVKKYDGLGNEVPGSEVVDFVIYLPKEFTYNSTNARTITIEGNSSTYSLQVEGNPSGGVCPWEDDTTNCGYTDEKLSTAPTFRIWKDNGGVIGLNPQGYMIDGYYLSHMVLLKNVPNTVFTNDEVAFWKDLFDKVGVVNN